MLLGARLYRNLLREARNLPDQLASTYYRERIRCAFRDYSADTPNLQSKRQINRAQQLLRHLQAANDGYLHALTRVIETSHGLRGPQRHANLAPFLERDRHHHTFSAPLASLVGSPVSHTSRPPTASQMLKPPTLPERANPNSEEARLLGPLASERVRAIKRRWWNSQTGKIRAPVALQVFQDGQEIDNALQGNSLLLKVENGLEGFNLDKGRRQLKLLEAKAQVPGPCRPLPPKRLQNAEQRAIVHKVPPQLAKPVVEDSERRRFRPTSRNTKWHNPKEITGRFLRRRATAALEIAPIVRVHITQQGKATYDVRRSHLAKGEKGHLAAANGEDLAWLLRGEARVKEGTGKRK